MATHAAAAAAVGAESDDEDGRQPPATCVLLNIPEDILYSILAYAAPRFERAAFLCHHLAPTCHAMSSAVDSGLHGVWSAVLASDYQGSVSHHGSSVGRDGRSSSSSRRASKRLRRSPRDSVAASHQLLIERTGIVHFCLAEWANSKESPLSVGRLRWALREYGPNVRVNHRVETGGTLLVECCRARHVKEGVILSCARELVERYGADPNLAAASERRYRTHAANATASAAASGASRRNVNQAGGGLTPLCIAAARGMASVTSYLLRSGASPLDISTGRFRLHMNRSKSVSGSYRPLEFARAMQAAEMEQGAGSAALKDLNKCIRLLQKAEKELETTANTQEQ